MIVAITGPICAGKGKVAEMFRDDGFTHHSFSAELRQVARERGIEVNRENLSELGRDLRKESPGKSILGTRLLEKVKKEAEKGKNKWVLEGLRDIDEIDLFRKHEMESKKMRFILVAVDAPQKLRFERLKKRRRHGDLETFEEFKEVDDRENKGGHGQEVNACMKRADYMIQNDGTLEQLREKVEGIVKEING